jgi:hypothetical protein
MSGQTMRSNAPVTLAARLLCLVLAAGGAAAQEAPAPAHAAPRPDQLEPAVDTSKSTATAAEPATAPAAVAAPAPAAAAPKSAAGTAAPKGAPKKPAGADRLNLDTTDVRGNRELPKVMYIVPWKHSDLGDLVGRPTNSLLDEVLQPLDRDVFRRENRYYDALKPDQGGAKADAVQGSDVKP